AVRGHVARQPDGAPPRVERRGCRGGPDRAAERERPPVGAVETPNLLTTRARDDVDPDTVSTGDEPECRAPAASDEGRRARARGHVIDGRGPAAWRTSIGRDGKPEAIRARGEERPADP